MNSITDDFFNEFATDNGLLTLDEVRQRTTSGNNEQEYQRIIEIAKSNVLDRKVVEYASRFNDLSDFDYFVDELLSFADFQRQKTAFRERMKGVRKQIAKQPKQDKQPFTIEVLQQFLDEKNIAIRENAITHEIEAENLPLAYCFDGSASHLGTILYSELKKADLSAAQTVIENYIMVIAKQHAYNPVAEMLKGKIWDGKDRLKELYDIMHISNKFQRKLIEKWLMQALTIALYNSEKEPISAEGVLVLVGEQAIRKISILRKLEISNKLCKTGLSLDCKNKDSVITAVSCFIGELGELESTFKSDIQALKAFFTQEFDTFRKPYGRSYEKVTRHSTYIATCNSKEFLIDETGNRRYWTIDCEQRFDLEKLQKFDEIQLWLQVYNLIERYGKQAFRLSPEELKELNTHNETHEKKLKAQQEIEDIQSKESDDNYKIVYELMTTTDFKNEWERELRTYSVIVIGRVLDKLGYEVEIVERKNGKTAKLRRLPKQLCYPINPK